jgi:hypothetical protein
VLLIGSMLLVGCNSGGGGPADDVPYRAKLYLTNDESLLPEPISGRVTTTHYMSDSIVTEEWRVDAGAETLADEFTYSLVMASTGTTQIDLAVLLETDDEEVVIAEDSFVIDSERYMPYRGTFTATDSSVTEGETLILRLEASGDDYGMEMGGLATYTSVFEAAELADEVMGQRAAALTWLIDNISLGEESDVMSTELFHNTLNQLDIAIYIGDNASWLIGWGLTQSELPYRLTWENNLFTAEELTLEEAGDLGLEEMQINFGIE